MTRHKKIPLPLWAGSAAVPPSPCGRAPTENAYAFSVGTGGGDGGGVNSCHPDARLTHHTLRPDAPPPLRAPNSSLPLWGRAGVGAANTPACDKTLASQTARASDDNPPPLPAPNHPLPCEAGERWGGGVKTRAATTALTLLALTLLALAFLALALPAHGKNCGTVVYKGKKTNIACSVALPNGKAKTPPPKPANTLIPPIQLPGDPPPAPVAPAAAPATAEPVATGQCYATLTINGQKRRIQQHCPLLPLTLAPVRIAEPSGDFKTRQEQHKALINQLAAKYQIDPALVHAVISVESGYNSNAVSGKGAVGLMQLMPGTAGDMNVADPYNPANNLEGGIKYLSQQLSRFQNTEQALAAYNAGPQSLLRYRGQIPPYNETRQYIQRVMHYKNRYQNDWQQHIK